MTFLAWCCLLWPAASPEDDGRHALVRADAGHDWNELSMDARQGPGGPETMALIAGPGRLPDPNLVPTG